MWQFFEIEFLLSKLCPNRVFQEIVLLAPFFRWSSKFPDSWNFGLDNVELGSLAHAER